MCGYVKASWGSSHQIGVATWPSKTIDPPRAILSSMVALTVCNKLQLLAVEFPNQQSKQDQCPNGVRFVLQLIVRWSAIDRLVFLVIQHSLGQSLQVYQICLQRLRTPLESEHQFQTKTAHFCCRKHCGDARDALTFFCGGRVSHTLGVALTP